jgi:hypothetical protein
VKEVATSESDIVEAEDETPVPERPAKDKTAKAKPPAAEQPGDRLSPELRAVRASEDLSLRELLDTLGSDGSYRIRVTRKVPTDCKDPATGRIVKTEGFLKEYEGPVDESVLKREHGGGTYQLKISRMNPKGNGGFIYFAQRQVNIAGDPNLDDPCLTRVPQPSAGAAPAAQQPQAGTAESPTLAAKAMDVLTGQLAAMREDRNEGRSEEISPVVMQMMQMMRDTLDRTQAELSAVRKEGSTRPAEDPFKDNLLNNLMRDDNARLSSVRAQYESELRMVKENALAEQRRLEERHERYQSEARNSHEREIANIRQSHEAMLVSVRASYEMQNKLLESDLRRLERDNGEMRVEVKELRAKHGKSIVEQAKDLNDVKEALGLGGDEEQSTIDKVVGAVSSPAVMGVVERFMAGRQPAAAPPPPAAAALAARPRRTPDGKFLVMPNGEVRPVRVKPKVITATLTNPDGTAGPTLTLPAIPEDTSKQVTDYLERAFAGNQDPVIVAQSGRALVPDEIMAVIREHGVDVFLQKVARLPSGSPLSTQAGKNWVRKVGEALVE